MTVEVPNLPIGLQPWMDANQFAYKEAPVGVGNPGDWVVLEKGQVVAVTLTDASAIVYLLGCYVLDQIRHNHGLPYAH